MDEPTRQAAIISKLCAAELNVSYHEVIIELLTKSYEHFKALKASRMILHVASLMATEYFDSQNFVMAKK